MTSATNETSFDCSTKIWSGLKKISSSSGCSVGQCIFQRMKKNPEQICQISDVDGISLTYSEMLTISIRIAQNLNTAGGQIIGSMTVCSTYQAPALFAAYFNGTVFHAINPSADKKTIAHLFGITRPTIVFCDANNYSTLVAACEDIELKPQIYTIDGKIEGVASVHDLMKSTGTEDTFQPRDCKDDDDDTATILCSSGTTGLPKGVCLSHSRIIEFLKPFPERSITFNFSNMDWLSGLSFLLCSVFFSLTRVCTTESFSPQKLREIIEKYNVNIVALSGSYLTRFVKSGEAELCDLSRVECMAVLGGNVSFTIYSKMQGLMKNGVIANFYVGTEFGGVTAKFGIGKPKSVGQLSHGIHAKIVDDDGNSLGIGEVGEILVQNGPKWRGYYGNPEESQKMFDSEGWYHTGDVGYFDEDGDLNLVDRKKEVMKYKGFQYSTQEIENCIMALTDVAEVCVFGILSEEYGDLPSAAVVMKPGSKLTNEDILEHVKSEMPESKWLHGGVFIVESIPKTANGKYIRNKARDLCLEMKKV